MRISETTSCDTTIVADEQPDAIGSDIRELTPAVSSANVVVTGYLAFMTLLLVYMGKWQIRHRAY